MKLTSQKFTVEGYQDQATWIGKLFTPLNSFISQVYQGFSNSLTVEDNLYQEFKSLTFVNETTNFPISFTTKFKKYPEMVLVGTCVDSTGAYSSVQPLVKWSYSDGTLSISSISGLTTSLKYTIKLLIIYQ
jgi:hypothetical protein